ncbi:sensor histidine kinase [Pseudorhizobium flavum]|uniref:sensor histidine kinase n=1 Tax=Pseudorhizobium flavum TaxID=1335061 RepID=UPI002491961D|nr:sensor histidine kinase [Pseudorhizobium flavum]
MKRRSVTARLLLLTLLALMPAMLVLIYNLISARQTAYREIHINALTAGHVASLEVRRIVSSVRSTLEVLSTVPITRTGPGRPCSDYLRIVDEKLDMIESITVLDSSGTLQCASQPTIATDFSDRDYFRDAVDRKEFIVGTYIIDRITGEPALPLALPVLEGERAARVVVAYLDLNWLGARVRERELFGGNALTIADRNGVILAREPFPERFVGTPIPEEYQRLVRAPVPGTLELTSQDGTRRVIGYYPDQESLYVSAGTSVETGLQQVGKVTRFGVAVIALAIVGPFLVVWWAGHALIRRPARQLVRSINAWRAGNESARTGMSGDGTFETIGGAIDAFMDELALRREQQQKDDRMRQMLIRELDHRIKNILSMVQAVARQTFRSSQSMEEASEAFFRRLHAMAGAHQLLTKNWQSASLKATVETAIQPFEDPAHPRFSIDGPDLEVASKIALSLSMALHELCTNAAKYGALSTDAGRIEIRWCFGEGGAPFTFSWTEQGGPSVERPSREGFGTVMIERVLSQQLDAEVTLEYRPDGLRCDVRSRMTDLLGTASEEEEAAEI